jgi:ADP-ribose pyrophosphatase YjhB (NUDIX family)
MHRYGAAGVVLNSAGKVLLVRESHPDENPWVPPGGGIEPGETPREAASREVAEEAGIAATLSELIGVYALRDDGSLWFVFAGTPTSDTAGVPDGREILETGWFEPSNLPSELPARVAEIVADAVAGRRGLYVERW